MWKRWALAGLLLAAVLLLVIGRGDPSAQAARQQLSDARAAATAAGMRFSLAEILPRPDQSQQDRLRALTNAAEILRAEPRQRGATSPRRPGRKWDIPDVRVLQAGLTDGGFPLTAATERALDECVALLQQGPLVTTPVQRGAMLLPHLASLKVVADGLAERISRDCSQRETNAVNRDLAALTLLSLDWTSEESLVSQSVRSSIQRIAFEATRKSVHEKMLSDAQIQELKDRWLAADFRPRLPQFVEVEAAEISRLLEIGRQEAVVAPWEGIGYALRGALTSPRGAWDQLTNHVTCWHQQQKWARVGSYRDEARLLDHYRQRFTALRQAAAEDDWPGFRRHGAATNALPPANLKGLHIQYLLNSRALAMAWGGDVRAPLTGEIFRRVLVTALAAEQFRREHGRPAGNLGELKPKYLDLVAKDYVTGRYLDYAVIKGTQFNVWATAFDLPGDQLLDTRRVAPGPPRQRVVSWRPDAPGSSQGN